LNKNQIVVTLYVSEKEGNDETGKGTEAAPFKTVFRALTVDEVRIN